METEFRISQPYERPMYSKFSVGGYTIPYVVGRLIAEDTYEVVLDNRFSYHIKFDAIETTMQLLADAMAIAAGYNCHGTNNRRNLHAEPESIGISHVENEDGSSITQDDDIDFSDISTSDIEPQE